jgi:hypothetical protein
MMPSLISGWPNLALSADLADLLPVAGDEIFAIGVGEAHRRHGADVGPGGKSLFTAGDDDAAHQVVRLKGLKRAGQLVHQLVVQGVELLGAVQGDDADLAGVGAFCAGGDGFKRHGGVSWG